MLQVAAAGCFAINCVGEIPDAATLSELKRSNQDLRFIACHMRGTPETMQKTPLRAAEVMDDVMGYFKAAMTALLNAGFRRESVWLDPGIGFGKTDAANTTLILGAAKLRSSGKLVWGVSRKGFLGRAFGIPEAKSRDAVSKVLESILALGGADMIRTHDVAGLHSALRALTAEA
jgi:dihydropteroate synthase